MARVSVVKPQYGPTMPELVGRLPRIGRLVVYALVVLLILLGGFLALRSRKQDTNTIVRGASTFNLTYGSLLKRVTEPGALFALRRERRGLFLDSYVVRQLTLPPYHGAAGGLLPLYSVGYAKGLRKRYGDFELVTEGRTRINNAIGYQLVMRAKRGKRTLYIRELLLVPDLPEGLRRGVAIELESTPAAGTPGPDGVGNAGPLKQAMRSFRFGTSTQGAATQL
jgi:hypothetical protein